jgi:hypothetical protein
MYHCTLELIDGSEAYSKLPIAIRIMPQLAGPLVVLQRWPHQPKKGDANA